VRPPVRSPPLASISSPSDLHTAWYIPLRLSPTLCARAHCPLLARLALKGPTRPSPLNLTLPCGGVGAGGAGGGGGGGGLANSYGFTRRTGLTPANALPQESASLPCRAQLHSLPFAGFFFFFFCFFGFIFCLHGPLHRTQPLLTSTQTIANEPSYFPDITPTLQRHYRHIQ